MKHEMKQRIKQKTGGKTCVKNSVFSAMLGAFFIIFAGGNVMAQKVSNPNYITYPEPELIARDLSGLMRVYRKNYDKFIAYPAANGGKILLIATKDISDEQLLRAYAILDFFLTDVPGSEYGFDKTEVANAMADNKAVLVMAGGVDGDSPIRDSALEGQPLYQLEFPVEGSEAYITNDFEQRDAGFEEIFHLVHDYGIGTKYSDGPLKASYHREIHAAMENALTASLWGRGDRYVKDWLKELADEGSLEQEYIVSVIDSYYGFWGSWHESSGGMWGIYVAKTRSDVKQLDPLGAALMTKFLPATISYMARIDPEFEGIFDMSFNPDLPYTHKSQYLVNARLLGDLPSELNGNNHDNILIGNRASNTINGRGGIDVVQYPGDLAQYQVIPTGDMIKVKHGRDIDTLLNVEILRFTDQDISLD